MIVKHLLGTVSFEGKEGKGKERKGKEKIPMETKKKKSRKEWLLSILFGLNMEGKKY